MRRKSVGIAQRSVTREIATFKRAQGENAAIRRAAISALAQCVGSHREIRALLVERDARDGHARVRGAAISALEDAVWDDPEISVS